MAGKKKTSKENLSKENSPVSNVVLTRGRPMIYTEERIEEEAEALLEWIKEDSSQKVYIGSFARERGYDRARLSEFSRKNEIFSRAMRKAMAWQEEKFLRNGLSREWDAAQVRYTMARVCGDEWKASWDQPQERAEANINVNINKI